MILRILLLVPHPDDEVIGCATTVARLQRAAGGSVRFFALYLTTGVPDAAVEWPWQRGDHAARVARRREEALAVARAMDLEPVGFCAWPSRHLRFHLAEARAEIRARCAAHAVDQLWAPAYEGAHQDHDTANFLASTLAQEWPVVEYSEYNAWPGGGGPGFPEPTGRETIVTLSVSEAAQKVALLDLYRSETRNLRHIRAAQEALRPLATYDYRRPPHPGRLFYERFAWVPIPHPRVDFTPATEVCASFARFSAARSSVDPRVDGKG